MESFATGSTIKWLSATVYLSPTCTGISTDPVLALAGSYTTVAPHGIAMASPIITFSLTANRSGVPCSVCLLLMASAVTTWIGVSSRTVIGALATAVGPGPEGCRTDPVTEDDP